MQYHIMEYARNTGILASIDDKDYDFFNELFERKDNFKSVDSRIRCN